ncbi:MAG: intermembrane transport protein PqiB [Pseudomonadota bacterium]
MSDVVVERRARWSAVWLIPFAAFVFALILIVHNQMNEGPEIEIRFSSAEGISAGQTEVKRLAVSLGTVRDVRLNDDFAGVTVVVKLNRGTESLLREDTQFWVVRPRIGADGVSGLNTLLSGAYIEISPGRSDQRQRVFKGLDDIPVTPNSTPGLRLSLVSDRAASISVGSPVLYNGYRVGRVERSELSSDGRASYQIFIDAPYDDLVNSNTRFWNASGLHVEAGEAGFSLHTESLEALLSGGIAFGLPDGVVAGGSITSDTEFSLAEDIAAVNEPTYPDGDEYLMLFDTSVRGLRPGAPVDYRGVRLGTVLRVAADMPDYRDELSVSEQAQMPVLVRMEPQRLGVLRETGLSGNDQAVVDAIAGGLRASLATGNLLTGSLYIDLDFYDNVAPAEVQALGEWILLPTVEAGIAQIERQVSTVLEKLQSLPVEEAVVVATQTLENISAAVKTADRTLLEANQLLAQPETRDLPGNLNDALQAVEGTLAGLDGDSALYGELRLTLTKLQQTLREAERVFSTINARPSSLVFSSDKPADPEPQIQ